jgi:PII-like signaling protein
MKRRRFKPTHVLKLSSNSEIVIECPDERAALSIARKIMEKTGSHVTVSDADRRPVGSVPAPARH